MGPDRYETIFSDKFEIGELRDKVCHGTLNPLPKDLFAMIRKNDFHAIKKLYVLFKQKYCKK